MFVPQFDFFLLYHFISGRKSCNRQFAPRVSKPCNFSGMPEFFICYIHYLFGFSSAFWQEFQLMYRFPCRNHIIFYVILKKRLTISSPGATITQQKQEGRQPRPHLPLRQRGFISKASRVGAMWFGAGAAASAFFVCVMEVLYHRQIRSSAQRRNLRQGSPPDRFRRNHAWYRLVRVCAGHGRGTGA